MQIEKKWLNYYKVSILYSNQSLIQIFVKSYFSNLGSVEKLEKKVISPSLTLEKECKQVILPIIGDITPNEFKMFADFINYVRNLLIF